MIACVIVVALLFSPYYALLATAWLLERHEISDLKEGERDED